jgi:hypothetical protein
MNRSDRFRRAGPREADHLIEGLESRTLLSAAAPPAMRADVVLSPMLPSHAVGFQGPQSAFYRAAAFFTDPSAAFDDSVFNSGSVSGGPQAGAAGPFNAGPPATPSADGPPPGLPGAAIAPSATAGEPTANSSKFTADVDRPSGAMSTWASVEPLVSFNTTADASTVNVSPDIPPVGEGSMSGKTAGSVTSALAAVAHRDSTGDGSTLALPARDAGANLAAPDTAAGHGVVSTPAGTGLLHFAAREATAAHTVFHAFSDAVISASASLSPAHSAPVGATPPATGLAATLLRLAPAIVTRTVAETGGLEMVAGVCGAVWFAGYWYATSAERQARREEPAEASTGVRALPDGWELLPLEG